VNVPHPDRSVPLHAILLAAWLLPASALGQAPGGKPGAPTSAASTSAAPTSAASTSAAPTSAAAADPRAGQARTAEEQNDLKVRTLEERVTDLKEKVFRTKARLMNLQEMVIGGDITSGAKAVIVHRNEMGSSFYLESVTYALDGAPIYTKADLDGDLDKREEFEVFNGRVVPGNHQVAVQMVFRGHGFGLFSYLKDYRFKTQSAYTLNAEPGKVITVKVIGYEKGGLTSELKDRPSIKYEQDVQKEEPASRKTSPVSEGATK
jgi:hypothetical protein